MFFPFDDTGKNYIIIVIMTTVKTDVKVLFLVAGYGTRLQRDLKQEGPPHHHQHLIGIPKALLPLGGKPLLTHWIDALQSSNVDTVKNTYLVCNSLYYNSFLEWTKTVPFESTHIYNNQTRNNENRLGAVQDIEQGVQYFNLESTNVLVIAGDILFLKSFNLCHFLNLAQRTEGSLITYYTVPDSSVSKRGIIEVSDEGKVIGFLEKPSITDTFSRKASPCFYYLRPDAIQLLKPFLIEKSNGSLEERDATGTFLSWIWSKVSIWATPVEGRIDIGGLDSLIEAEQ